MNLDRQPTVAKCVNISVVVASFSGERLLSDCLARLTQQCHLRNDIEIIAPTTLDRKPLARVRERFPVVHFVERSPETNVFKLRAAGASLAQGRLVLLTEDHTRASDRWIEQLEAAHHAGHQVVGGPVDNGRPETAYGWGLYFCEYGIHTPPMQEGITPVLSGLNIGYDRDMLDNTRAVWSEELHENEIHDALRALGTIDLWMIPSAIVDTRLNMTPREAILHLATGGRQYGRHRVRRARPAMRAMLAMASPLVPIVLFARICFRVLRRCPIRLLRIAQSLPWIALLLGSWCVGEASGYLTTRRGASMPDSASATEGGAA